MRVLNLIVVCILTAQAFVQACTSPGNIEGVAFTDGEVLNLEKLEAIGTENVNYYKDGAVPHVAIRYAGHYDPRTTVYIGNYGLSYQQDVYMNCMGVVYPIDGDAYEPIDVSVFDFAEAVRVELAWLSDIGVIDLTAETIEKIDSALDASSNGGVQYWTHAETVMGYNSWYEYDDAAGVWGGGDGVYGGVNSVRGVDAVKGCSVVQPESGLPPEPLGTTGVIQRQPGTPLESGRGALSVSLSRVVRGNTGKAVFDMRGRSIGKGNPASGAGGAGHADIVIVEERTTATRERR
jgi:hypothetical protein